MSARPTVFAACLLLALPLGAVTLAQGALAQPRRAPPASLGAHLSHGFPNAGKLVGGKRWSDTKFAHRLADHSPKSAFGMPGLVALVQSSAHKVAQKFPKSVITVGDLSAREGGPLPGHNSHQSGRDMDIGFYTLNDRGRPVVLKKFVAFDGEGRAVGDRGIVFDDRRNWAFVEALLTDPRTEVRTLFVASWLKARLLKHAAEAKAPKALIEKASAVMMQPPNAEPHHDHFHVRIGCVASQRGSVCHDDSIDRGKPRVPSGGEQLSSGDPVSTPSSDPP